MLRCVLKVLAMSYVMFNMASLFEFAAFHYVFSEGLVEELVWPSCNIHPMIVYSEGNLIGVNQNTSSFGYLVVIYYLGCRDGITYLAVCF